MANIVKENGSELIGYLDALVDVQTHHQEALDIKQELMAADKKTQKVRPAPVKSKPVISWKIIVAILAVGVILDFVHILLFFAAVAAAGVYVYSRFKLSADAYKKEMEAWNAENAEKEEQHRNIAAGMMDIDVLINNCSNALTQLYNAGPLHPDYRNLSACATFYDWFSKGMTTSLSRNGSDPGAYVMYEEKLRHGELMGELKAIKEDVGAIRASQARLYEAVVEMKNTVSTISKQLISINKAVNLAAAGSIMTAANTAAIKENTAVSAYYSKVNAANSAALNKYVGAAYTY